MRGFALSVASTASFLALLACLGAVAAGPDAGSLLNTGTVLVGRTHYLEALDLLDEARDILEHDGKRQTALYSDVLYALAETKIKGRLHQSFPADYVKTALDDIQAANKIREKIGGILPQKLAQGYYLEGIILKKFFMEKEKAKSCLMKAVNIDRNNSAARREWAELIIGER